MTKRKYAYRLYLYLALISALLLYVGLGNAREHDPWGMGDWLTNYAGGFVRRGLIGQVLLDISHWTPHISVYVLTLAIQLACYGVVFGVLLFLLQGVAWKAWMIAMVYSPATLSFTLFDPLESYRKEILYFALLAAIILSLNTAAKAYSTAISLVLALSMAVLVLTHEGMFLYYPYIVCAFLISLREIKRALLLSVPGAFVGFCAFIAAVKHPGGLRAVTAVCSSLGVNDVTEPPCSGALLYMTKTASMAHLDVLDAISYWHLKSLTPFFLIMALGPMVAGLIVFWRDETKRFDCRVLILCSLTAWLFTLALFDYSFDWNRWIYIHVFSSLLLMLTIEYRSQQALPEMQREVLPRRAAARYVTVGLLALSMAGWQLSFYHHFPLPGERLALYLRNKIKGIPMHKKVTWRPPPDSSRLHWPSIPPWVALDC